MTPKQTTPTPTEELKSLKKSFARRAEKFANRVWRYVREHKNSLDSEIHCAAILRACLTVYDEIEKLAFVSVENRRTAERELRETRVDTNRKLKAASEKISSLEEMSAAKGQELVRLVARIEGLEKRLQVKATKKKKAATVAESNEKETTKGVQDDVKETDSVVCGCAVEPAINS